MINRIMQVIKQKKTTNIKIRWEYLAAWYAIEDTSLHMGVY